MLRKIVRALPMLMLLFSPVAAHAQDRAVVAGQVTDAQGQPQKGVLIRIDNLNVGAMTGDDGQYRLVIPANRVPAGAVSVHVSRVGFAGQRRAVQVAVGQTQTQDFHLVARAPTETPAPASAAPAVAGGGRRE